MAILDEIIVEKGIDKYVRLMKGIKPLEDMDNSFALVAVRCNSDLSTGKRKLVPGQIYYFLDGYSVEPPYYVSPQRRAINSLYDDFLVSDLSGSPHVQISAIVGKNGSGKSSLVEFIMRLINNLGSATFGEWKHGTSTERLHFIHGVCGDLWYVADNHLYQLHVENARVALYLISDLETESSQRGVLLFSEGDIANSGPRNVLARMDNIELRRLYEHFFYTLVSNFSLYAYNTRDFANECDTHEKERLASADKENQYFPIEQRCWLHGLFHKNDGYQTPMVISPFRSEGNININRENHLANERLVTLFIKHASFRNINGHLEAFAISYGPKEDSNYGLRAIHKDFDLPNLTKEGYEFIADCIITRWETELNADFSLAKNKPYYHTAIQYIVYKTFKIAYTYRQHHKNFDLLYGISDVCQPELIFDMVESQIKDMSHTTRKLHQALAYLIYDIYTPDQRSRECVMTLDEIHARWRTDIASELNNSAEFLRNSVRTSVAAQSIIPPPFLHSELLLREKADPCVIIDFETLSSGEKQLIYAVSSILYHLDNLNSVKYDSSDPLRIPYRNVLMVLEEIELYFHPELQQQFITYLLEGIKKFDFDVLSGIHIMLVTHSPYVLSDIPQQNVLALTESGECQPRRLKTFCGNIHEMLKDSFFLSHGSQGDFAQWEVGHIMACLNIHRVYRKPNNAEEQHKLESYIIDKTDPVYEFALRYRGVDENTRSRSFSYDDFSRDFTEERLRQLISIIDEPIVRSILIREINDTFVQSEQEARLERIRQLEDELNRLREEE